MSVFKNRKIWGFLSLWICSLWVHAQATLGIDDFSIVQGETKEVLLELDNTVDVRAFQVRLLLPENMTLASQPQIVAERQGGGYDEFGDWAASLKSLSFNRWDDGSYMIAVNSDDGLPFSGTEGGVVSLKITAGWDVLPGKYEIGLKDIELVYADGVNFVRQDDCTSYASVLNGKFELTYLLDGEVYHCDSVKWGTSLSPLANPEKEGHTFSGWSDIPETMPVGDVTVTGSFAVNYYTVTYILDGEVFKAESLAYGADVVIPDAPAKEGHTFSGWSESPATMPANDVTVTGNYSVNQYSLVYMVDGVEYKRYTLDYGANITAEAVPEKEGYTFSGWSDIPETMPAGDITVTGSFTVNYYTVTYILDGEVFKTESVAYGTAVPTPSVPGREGYNFSGWGEVPASMPANDLTFYGSYSINKDLKFNLVYMIDGVEYKKVVLSFGDVIVLDGEPTKEGHTFSGWSEVPVTMPLQDVTVTGTFTANIYTVTYIIDGETFKTESVTYGTVITTPDVPAKDGHAFSGWGEIPAAMPAENLTFEGYYTVNQYSLVYMVDGVEYKRYTLDYGTNITAEAVPEKEGYTFSGWSEIPEIMPADDVTVTGSFTVNYYTVTYILDGEVVKTESVAYGAAVATPEVPAKDGYTFDGWKNVPATMPADDVEITGKFVLGVNVDVPGTLHTMFTCPEDVDTLVISGVLYKEDFAFIHDLPKLCYLDVKDVIVGAREEDTLMDILYDGMFAGMAKLRYLSLPASVTDVGSGIVSPAILRELHWNCDVPLTEAIMDDADAATNMIVYVSGETECTYNGNVVRNGVAKNIVLMDGVPLQISEPFVAERISYTRNFDKKTRPHEPGGWESIVLPFDVQNIVTGEGDVIAPFNSGVDGTKGFMLAAMTEGGYVSAKSIKANVPYILAMPNSDLYDISNIIKGDITFEAKSVTVCPTLDAQVVAGKEYDLVPAYENVERGFSVYALNEAEYDGMLPGSAFVSGLRDVMPFEVYASTESRPASAKIHFVIGGDDSATDISVLYDDRHSDFRIQSINGVLYIESLKKCELDIYSADGRIVRHLELEKGTNKIDGLDKGTYIVCKKKFLIS